MILGKDDVPYAAQIELRWSIVGSETPHHETDMMNSLCYHVAVKEIPQVTPMYANRARLERDLREVKENSKNSVSGGSDLLRLT